MRIPAPFGRKKARIEIIPLIDVVFFLLATFVMVSLSMVKNEGIAVNLPAAATSSAQDRKTSVTITVAEDGSLYLNQEKIGESELRGKLEVLRSGDPELKVFINGDEAADFGAAVRALDEVRKMGITKVAIQTRGAGRDRQ